MPSDAFNQLVELMAQNPDKDLPLEERRAAMEKAAVAMPPPPGATFEDVEAAGVPCEWVTDDDASADRIVVYLHGGSYTACSPRTHRRITAGISRETGARVLAPDYRLAPENPFPAAIEDAVAVYRWLLDGGAAPEHIAVTGDSAGGGLAIAMLVSARDAGLAMPAVAAVISPWVDMEVDSESVRTKASVDPMLDTDRLKLNAERYLGGSDRRDPLASPIYADLAGLPPLLIQVGGREILLDDATRLADKAKADGVDVTLEVHEEMIHVWHILAGLAPEGDDGVRGLTGFLRPRLASVPAT